MPNGNGQSLYSRVGQRVVYFLQQQSYHHKWGLKAFVPEHPDDCDFRTLVEQLEKSDDDEEFFEDNRENMILLVELLHRAMRRIKHVHKLLSTGAPRRKKNSCFEQGKICNHDHLESRLLWILFSEKSEEKNPHGLKYHAQWGVENLIPSQEEEYPGKNLVECLQSEEGSGFFREHSHGMIKVVKLLHQAFSILEEADAYYSFRKHHLPTQVGDKRVASAASLQEEEESDDEPLAEKKRKRVKRVED